MIPFDELCAALEAWRRRQEGGAAMATDPGHAPYAAGPSATPLPPAPPLPPVAPLPPLIEPQRTVAGPDSTGEVDLADIVD